MPEKVRVVCICSHGMGSCYIMKWTAEAVLKKHGVEQNDMEVVVGDMSTSKADPAKILLVDIIHGKTLGEALGKKVVIVKNMTDKDEMDAALTPAVKEMYPDAIKK